MRFVDLKAQYDRLRGPINDRIKAVLDHGQYILGEEVEELEVSLAGYVGANHCVSVSSGTDALLIALLALDVQPGDQVVTSPFSFFAAAEVIALLKAEPVFVDIDRRTYNLDPRRLGAAITPRTKAILPVSLYGQCADYDAINGIAAGHGIAVIEDGAQSFGATYKGRRSCNLTDIAATSFFPSKPLGCYGEGGALFTNDDSLAERFRQLRDHGQTGRYRHARIGINGRLDSLQAAILLAKLEIFEEEVARRAQLGTRYSELIGEAFSDTDPPAVTIPHVKTDNTSVYAQYTVELPQRDSVQAAMRERHIPTAVHYPQPLHLQPAFAALGKGPGSVPVPA
ncbi:MAG: DegT/DnrJ/EryC1/StrS family aminotransferase, partial [Rhodospirillaceae bacterium]|nr:DegT/DnrJ/EryC1/StrS family aminotransferase [Rhodospirillaceae bacterium]